MADAPVQGAWRHGLASSEIQLPKRHRHCQFYQHTTNPLQIAVCVQQRWYDSGERVAAVHADSYQPISPRCAKWLTQIGGEVRDCWVETKKFYGALLTLAELAQEISVTFSDSKLQRLYTELVDVLALGKEELQDYLSLISLSRSSAILTGKTLRVAARAEGYPDVEALFQSNA